VAQRGAGTAREDSGGGAFERGARRSADGVYAGVYPVEPTDAYSIAD
jgi:hypothetical protein